MRAAPAVATVAIAVLSRVAPVGAIRAVPESHKKLQQKARGFSQTKLRCFAS